MSDLSTCYIMPARRSLYKLTLRSTIAYSINTIKHKELNLLISFFAPFFANGMALPNQAITLQESKTDFFNCTSCKWNVKTKLYKSSELSTKWNTAKGSVFLRNFCIIAFWPEGSVFCQRHSKRFMILSKYSLVWSILPVWPLLSENCGDISFLVKYQLSRNMAQLSEKGVFLVKWTVLARDGIDVMSIMI